MSKKLRDFLIFIVVMFFTIILELALNSLDVKEENIYLVFVLSILIIIIESHSIIYGLMASVLSVLSFNFFITEPRYSFVVNDPNYYVSFAMFFVVTFMVNSLVIQLQKQISLSKENERQINGLYNISSDLLHSTSNEQVFEHVVNRIEEQVGEKVAVITVSNEVYGEELDVEKYQEVMTYCLNSNTPVLEDNISFPYLHCNTFPICSAQNNYGILILEKEKMDERDIVFVQNVIEEMLVALDRNDFSDKQEQSQIQIEKEKFRTSLLRGLSHDLKTPLTMIQSGSEFLYESFETVPDESKKELISDIYNESCNLSHFVNNLLDMTRLENKDIKLNRRKESAEDIITEVLEKMKKRLVDTPVAVEGPNEMVEVYADTDLLAQVFYNLIENVVAHGKEGSSIYIKYYRNDDEVCFEVADNGGGIDEDKLETLFNGLTSFSIDEDKKRNHGLGLTIAKAITEAHGGTITGENNDIGGMTFRFTIKDKDE